MKLNRVKIFLSLVASILFFASAPVKAQTKMTIWVKEDKASSQGVAPMECFQVKYSSKDTAWQLFYGSIDGFKYQDGYRYSLSVKKYKVANPPADAPGYKYKLVKVLSKKKVATGSEQYWSYIYKNNWKLIQLNGVTLTNSKANIMFAEKDKRFSGSSGCNRMMGSYTTQGNKISFGAAASTKMMCMDEGTMKLENEFLAAISDGEYTFDVADQALNFYKGGKIIMMFGVNGPAKK